MLDYKYKYKYKYICINICKPCDDDIQQGRNHSSSESPKKENEPLHTRHPQTTSKHDRYSN